MSTGAADPTRRDPGETLRKRIPGVVIILLLTALLYHLYFRVQEHFANGRQPDGEQQEAVGLNAPGGRPDAVPQATRGHQLIGNAIPEEAHGSGRSAMLAGEAEGELARNRTRVIEAYDLGQRISSKLSDIETELTAWTAAINAFNDGKNDLSRQVATRQELVQQYSAVVAAQTMTPSGLQSWSSRLDAIHSRVAPAYSENRSHVVVTQEDIDLLSGLEENVTAARDQLRQHRRVLDIIEATAKRLDPGQLTLKEALANLQASRDDALRVKLAEAEEAAVREVEEKYAAQLAEERRKQQELLKEQQLEAERLASGERAKELAEIRNRRKELEDRIAAEKLEAEYQRDLPSIKSLLAPFLDNAITQPAAGNPISKGGPMKPTSLGALRGSGALEDSNEGLDFLFRVGGHPANMRTKGSFPTFVSQRPLAAGAERDQVQKAQQLLIKYGELLVRDGLLSK